MQLEEIYSMYKNKVYNLALQYVQNIEDAEEITQDVFVNIHLSLAQFKYNAELSTWIYKITINKSLDYIKMKKRKKRFGLITNLFHQESNEPRMDVTEFNHPGVQMENKEATKKIFNAINALRDNQRTAIILSKIEQKSQKEIAEIMQLNIGAVESLIARAKANLANFLQQNEG